jgi:DMSO reductase anchor subunit
MATTIFLQNEIFTKFIFPFLLIFFIVFAILEKTKLLGEKKQIHALISFVIGLIFITAVYPKLVVENLVLFLTVSLVCVFVVLLIWGFIFADKEGFKAEKWMKFVLGGIFGIAFIAAIIWATGWKDNISTFFLNSGISQTIVTNVLFVIVIAVALVLILKEQKKS